MSDQPNTTNADAVRPSRVRAIMLHLSLVLFALALLVRAGRVQLVEGSEWARRAERQHMRTDSLAAPRGTVTDARGVTLLSSREQVQLSIAPNQLRSPTARRNDHDSLAKGLARLGVSRAVVRKALDTTRRYVAVPSLFLPSEAAPVMAIRGVTSKWTMERVVTGTDGLRRLLGTIDREGQAQGGIERALDSLLTGTRGARTSQRDARGGLWDAPEGRVVRARPGHSVRLTINLQLQELVERELLDAVAREGAQGGDIVVLDPDDGAILALAGARGGRIAPVVTPLTEAYEPGSVLKPMFVARLIDEERVRPSDLVNTENGAWVNGGKKYSDEHKAAYMSVFDVVRWSSNIGTIKLVTQHLPPAAEYELLRDYGFGMATALPYPSEAAGTLREPSRWTRTSAAAHAIGYELAVTPVQLAAAYAALANGGELLEPALVREIRDPDGALVFRHARRVVRRVATPASTAAVRAMLKAVVDSGTGRAAQLAAFEVGGKSGTAQRAVGRGTNTTYDATFAGMFPMSDPQMVVVARLIAPSTRIFGGLVAAPMVREILRGAVASRDAALDRTVLARVARDVAPAATRRASGDGGRASGARAPADAAADGEDGLDDAPVMSAPREAAPAPARVVVTLPFEPDTARVVPGKPRTVPSVRGLSVRAAVRTLHAAGFHVRMAAGGVRGRTRPAAGQPARVGALVVLEEGGA